MTQALLSTPLTGQVAPGPVTSADRRLSVAPMMEWTDRHFRAFARGLTRHTLLYTEMIHMNALLRGDAARFLGHDAVEHPLALQVGGSDPVSLAACAKLAADWGYGEINLNVGCPSERVSAGRFGACLMAEPALVADCLTAMREATTIPVTVKHRIGIDDRDSYDDVTDFVATVAGSGCRVFTVHARKAWLSGLSPKENREIPPLRHDVVHRLKTDFPDLEIILNGGIRDMDAAMEAGAGLDGIMIGRAAYETPHILAEADQRVFGATTPIPSREEAVLAFLPTLERRLTEGVPLKSMTRHMLTIFAGVPGAKAWRRHLSTHAHQPGAGPEVVLAALNHMRGGRSAA